MSADSKVFVMGEEVRTSSRPLVRGIAEYKWNVLDEPWLFTTNKVVDLSVLGTLDHYACDLSYSCCTSNACAICSCVLICEQNVVSTSSFKDSIFILLLFPVQVGEYQGAYKVQLVTFVSIGFCVVICFGLWVLCDP